MITRGRIRPLEFSSACHQRPSHIYQQLRCSPYRFLSNSSDSYNSRDATDPGAGIARRILTPAVEPRYRTRWTYTDKKAVTNSTNRDDSTNVKVSIKKKDLHIMEPLRSGFGIYDKPGIGRAANLPGTTQHEKFKHNDTIKFRLPNRTLPISVRVTVPKSHGKLPVMMLIHGEGSTSNLTRQNSYAPLAEYYALHGFVVIQSSINANLNSTSWRKCITDCTHILDRLSNVEARSAPKGASFDSERVVVVGHLLGVHTASVLLGMSLGNPDTDYTTVYTNKDKRIKAGVLLSPLSDDESLLSTTVSDTKPFLRHVDYSTLTTPTLWVSGTEHEMPEISVSEKEKWKDGFKSSPGSKDLLELKGADCRLGGISGETTVEAKLKENLEVVATVQRMTLAFLRSQIYKKDRSWSTAKDVFQGIEGLGKVISTTELDEVKVKQVRPKTTGV
ncbi:hypothetical protein EJ05DRAFT_7420 [Pseudovirgaria hyperparasitica]|uniref:Uncharacterized protein n=1 Tax=Pseudovirgaria hyperparasitica TaxID=470096 RepID=A0A6A6WKA6_9PEZI|nr:uncharacterized protein EJ05DRAFT_7420 [Pseudovirgaria hyperparasitica]KAF2762604.1 hypothetical protein EJ05DRAFT_7420 [Pseudovirgaria hyperparasitica]